MLMILDYPPLWEFDMALQFVRLYVGSIKMFDLLEVLSKNVCE